MRHPVTLGHPVTLDRTLVRQKITTEARPHVLSAFVWELWSCVVCGAWGGVA